MEEKPENFMMIDGLPESVGIKKESVFEKEVWNRAIEAAALTIPKYEDDNMNDIRENILRLKK